MVAVITCLYQKQKQNPQSNQKPNKQKRYFGHLELRMKLRLLFLTSIVPSFIYLYSALPPLHTHILFDPLQFILHCALKIFQNI